MNKDDFVIKRFEKCEANGCRFVSVKHLPSGLEVEDFYDGFVTADDLKKQVALLSVKVDEATPKNTFEKITSSSVDTLKNGLDLSDLDSVKIVVKEELEDEKDY